MSIITVYPDANPEAASVDGYVRKNDSANFATTRNASVGTAASDTDASFSCAVNTAAGVYDFIRAFLLFDTSAIPDNATDISAVLSLYVNTVTETLAGGSANIFASSPASNTGLGTGDYDQIGSVAFSTAKTLSSLSTSAYNDWTLNASGIAAINVGGVTKFSVLNSYDYSNTDPGLAVGNSTFNFNASDNGSNKPKLVITYTSHPADPTGASASSADGSQVITVAWTDNATDETEYYVERSDDGVSGWSVISGALSPNTTSYQDDVGAWSTTKYYRVRCYNGEGYSAYTSVVNAKTASQSPTIGTVTATSNSNNLTITWTDNSSDESSFRVERSNDGSTGWSEVGSVSAGIQTYTDTTVGSRDTRRWYRIRAKRDSDTRYSGYSSTANAYTAPADPSAFTVTLIAGVPRLAWTDNSSTETIFSIERKPRGGDYAVVATDTTTPYDEVDSLTADLQYTYRIRAFRSGDSIYSGYAAAASITTAPTPHTNLQVFPKSDVTGNVSVQLVWDKNARYDSGTKVERSTDDISYSTVATTAKGATTYEDTGLAVSTTYYYRVSPVGVSGAGFPTTAVTVLTKLNTVAGMSYAFQKKIRVSPRE